MISTMPPTPGSEHHLWESMVTILQQEDIDRDQLGIESKVIFGTMEKKKESFEETDESLKTHGNPSSGVQIVEPSSDIVVWWDEPEDQDPENPMNWSSTKKWFNICTISVISFIV
jgi:hypothetical protein